MLGKSKVKYIQSLGQKKHRDESGLFIAEGPKIVAELLEAMPGQIEAIYALPAWLKMHGSTHSNVEVIEVGEHELAKVSQLQTPNQVLAVVRKFERRQPLDPKGSITLALDTIQDPGNMGTMIRLADWFGVLQIVCSMDSADIYNPKVVQSTMGSIARVPVYNVDLPFWLQQQTHMRIYATALDGQDVTSMKKIKEGIIVIGNESKGISDAVMSFANVRITIPRKGAAESLNAAVAAGIVLAQVIAN